MKRVASPQTERTRDLERVRRALSKVLGRGAARAEIRRLGGGASNTSYLLAHGDDRYVLRLKQDSAGATLGLLEELKLLRVLAAAGIAAEPVGVDAVVGALLTRFVPGAVQWSADEARASANIVRIAELLRRLHAVPVELRSFEPVLYAQRYVDAAAQIVPLGRRELVLAAELEELAIEYQAAHASRVVCHNDLTASNILDAGNLVLVDFEYAARASPVLDLASLAAMNDYDRRQCRELLRAYFSTASPPISTKEFAKVVRMVRLIAYFWSLASART